MKKLVIILAALFALAGCYKDNSSVDDNSLPRYIIMLPPDTDYSLRVVFGENLTIEPLVYKIVNERDTIKNTVQDNLSYQWYINQDPMNFDTTRTLIGTELKLDTKVTMPPSSGNYFVSLHVTDNDNGLKVIRDWNVRIGTIYTNGAVIGYTRDDGATSEIALLVAPEVTRSSGQSLPEVQQFFDLYELANKEKIEGEISVIKETTPKDVSAVTLICRDTKQLYRVKSEDYILMDRNQEMFYLPEEEFEPMSVGNGYYQLLLVNNGKINVQDYQQHTQYSYPLEADDKGYYCRNVSTSVLNYDGSFGRAGVFYDELNGRFLSLPGKFGTQYMIGFNPNTGGAFDLNNLPGKISLAAGQTNDKRNGFILQDKTTGAIGLYIVAKDDVTDNGSLGLSVDDITDLEGVREAKGFVFGSKEPVVYYYTDKAVYALLLGDIPRTEMRMTLTDPDEHFSCLTLHQGGGRIITSSRVNDDGDTVHTYAYPSGRLLMIGIYNTRTKEGRLLNQYISPLGSGNFSEEFKWEYTGFGKITAAGAVQML